MGVSVTVCVIVCVCVSLEHKDTPVLTWPGTSDASSMTADGAIVDMHCLDEQGPQNIICYGTSMGKVHGLDLRVGRPVWTLQQEYRMGQSHAHTSARTCTYTHSHTHEVDTS